jgi:hypothetical protein
MQSSGGGGKDLAFHLKQVRKAGGDIEEFLPPPLPPGTEYLVEIHRSVRMECSSGQFGTQAVTTRMIVDWCEVRGVTLSVWEINAIVRIDLAARNAVRESKDE